MKRKSNIQQMMRLSVVICFLIFGIIDAYAQSRQDKNLDQEVQNHLAEAASYIEADNFAAAEASFRKAVSLAPDNDIARYNFGNLYLKNEKNRDAFNRLMQASTKTQDKSLRHKSFHNKGNLFMDEKRYAEAVEAYKSALRNNPTDEETRYNLALAKKMMEEEGGSGGDGDDEQEQPDQGGGEDQNEDQNEQDQPEDGNQDKDKNNEGEGNDDPNNEEGDQEKEEEKPQEGEGQNPEEEGKQQEQPPQQMEGKLSPDQIKNLLEAIENQEKDVQDKVNKKELKGTKVRSEKDW